MGKFQEFVQRCIVDGKTCAEINTQNKAEVLLDKFARYLDEEGGISGDTSITQTGVVAELECEAGQEIVVTGETTDTVKLVHQGRNFQPGAPAQAVGIKNGITVEMDADGCFVFTGTATADTFFNLDNKANPIYCPAGTYVIHCDWPIVAGESGNTGVGYYNFEVDGRIIATATSDELLDKTATLEEGGVVTAYLKFLAGTVLDGTMRISVERSSEYGGQFEPYWRRTADVTLPYSLVAENGYNMVFTEGDDVLTATASKTVKQIIEDAVTKKLVGEFSAYGLPMIYLVGDINPIKVSKDNEVSLTYTYGDRSGTCKLKGQGATSYSKAQSLGKLGKFNYTIKFDEPFEAKEGWGAQKKYCLKANFIDHSHARNVCSCKLWGQIVKDRNNAPAELTSLPNGGAIDGFPCIIMLNGEFHGLYTWNIPKDGWMFGSPKAIVCADMHCAATQFKALATLNGDFELEYAEDENDTGWVLTSLNRAIQAVMDSDGTDIVTAVEPYIDIASAIEYYIHTVDENANDCTDKNYLLVTFDGIKWYFSVYDRDSIYGLHWAGETFDSPAGNVTYENYAAKHALMGLIYNHKRALLKSRAIELRNWLKSEANVAQVFTNFIAGIPSHILAEDAHKYPALPSTSASNLAQILNWYRLRRAYLDPIIDSWV